MKKKVTPDKSPSACIDKLSILSLRNKKKGKRKHKGRIGSVSLCADSGAVRD